MQSNNARWGRFYVNPESGKYFIDFPEIPDHYANIMTETDDIDVAFEQAKRELSGIMELRSIDGLSWFEDHIKKLKEVIVAPTDTGKGQPIIIRVPFF